MIITQCMDLLRKGKKFTRPEWSEGTYLVMSDLPKGCVIMHSGFIVGRMTRQDIEADDWFEVE